MRVHKITPILRVTSVPKSFAWFESLGWKRGFSWNDAGMIPAGADRNALGEAGFGSVCSGPVEIFLCHGGQGPLGTIRPKFPGDDATDGVWMSWWLATPAEVDATVKIIYIHVPAAMMAINAWVMMLVASLIWIVRRHHVSALAAKAAAPVGLCFTLTRW